MTGAATPAAFLSLAGIGPVTGTAAPAASPGLAGIGPALAAVPRGRVKPDLIYLGWLPSGQDCEPGPPPSPPTPPEPDGISQDWLAAQRREHARLARLPRLACAASLALAAASSASWQVGLLPTGLALVVGGAAILGVTVSSRQLWLDRRALADAIRAERQRVAKIEDAQQREFNARLAEHTRRYREWQRRRDDFRRQPQWHAVTMPASVQRVDVAGGTLAGWSALLTTIAAPRLAVGGELTVVDLTEGGVASDLLALARGIGIDPAVWVLPADLPSLALGAGLDGAGLDGAGLDGAGAVDVGVSHEVLADVLATTVSAAERSAGYASSEMGWSPPAQAVALDVALLAHVLDALGSDASMPRICAALRLLGQVGGPAEHLGDLTPGQIGSLQAYAGRDAERVVVERARAIEATLRALRLLGTASARGPSRLKVAWLDPRAAASGNRAVAAYLAVALTAALRQRSGRDGSHPANAGSRLAWQQTICLLGAERLQADVLDQLSDAAESTSTGLILGYRSIPSHVRDRLGRGNAAVAFMRLGNAQDARLAAEQIGTEHRLVLSQFTETIGASCSETAGDSYASTVGTTDSVADSQSISSSSGRSRGPSRSGTIAPAVPGAANSAAGTSGSRSITEAISTGTNWGLSTSKTTCGNQSLASIVQRSREFLVEQHELQQLPHSAVVLCTPDRRVLLADVNPAIMALPTATLATRPAAASGK